MFFLIDKIFGKISFEEKSPIKKKGNGGNRKKRSCDPWWNVGPRMKKENRGSMVILWYLTGRAWPTEQPGDVLHPGVAIKTRLPGLRTNLRGSTTYDVFLDSFVYFFFFEEKNLTSGYSYRGWNVPRIRMLGWLDRSFVEFRDYRASFIDGV